MVVNRGCYLVKDVGAPTVLMLAEMCDEIFFDGKLSSIQCRRLGFLPDGPFIAYPWHLDINPKPKDDYKDLLALSVGKCSHLVE